MADIRPFRAWRFDPARVGELDAVTAPPYDVITPSMREELLERSPYNVVTIDLNPAQAGDDRVHNSYTRAAETFAQWKEEGALTRDPYPAFYVYEQIFESDGREHHRAGFLGALRIEDPSSGKVVAHEHTLAAPKEDRFRLTEATQANLSSIFQLYSDPQGAVDALLQDAMRRQGPDADVKDADGVRHRLWIVSEGAWLKSIEAAMAEKALFIADGHHRYETALNYRNAQRAKHPEAPEDAAFNFVLCTFVNMDNEGLVIWPTHRLVHGWREIDWRPFLTRLAVWFDLSAVTMSGDAEERGAAMTGALRAAARDGRHALGVYGPGAARYVAVLKDEQLLDQHGDRDRSERWRRLDPAMLHTLVLNRLLGIGPVEVESYIRYTRYAKEAIEAVDQHEAQVAFLLNATTIDELKGIAETREKMPEKSTYFYPKLLTGLVINSLSATETVHG